MQQSPLPGGLSSVLLVHMCEAVSDRFPQLQSLTGGSSSPEWGDCMSGNQGGCFKRTGGIDFPQTQRFQEFTQINFKLVPSRVRMSMNVFIRSFPALCCSEDEQKGCMWGERAPSSGDIHLMQVSFSRFPAAHLRVGSPLQVHSASEVMTSLERSDTHLVLN